MEKNEYGEYNSFKRCTKYRCIDTTLLGSRQRPSNTDLHDFFVAIIRGAGVVHAILLADERDSALEHEILLLALHKADLVVLSEGPPKETGCGEGKKAGGGRGQTDRQTESTCENPHSNQSPLQCPSIHTHPASRSQVRHPGHRGRRRKEHLDLADKDTRVHAVGAAGHGCQLAALHSASLRVIPARC